MIKGLAMRRSPKPSGMLQRSEVKQVSCTLSKIRTNILEKETTSNLETLQSITRRYQRIGNSTVIQAQRHVTTTGSEASFSMVDCTNERLQAFLPLT